ncbi:MAG: class I SAM-dependent methyltransferase [Clostridia bacterium]|nr:class I SAM-dependent methyltransferase [Clostridia bacterium]
MFQNDTWKDYELLDAAAGERLERWGRYILIRPDPQVIWNTERRHPMWKKADGVYRRSKNGGGSWVVSKMPADWNISYGDLTFNLRPMGFKHTGLFPEQAVNWDWFSNIIGRARRDVPDYQPKVLNLFAYTGGATAAAARAGAKVCHVDASKGMVAAAKENLRLSGLGDAPVRYIVDDCRKFVEREIRRGNKYDGVIMDPPSYGRGPNGEVWKLEECAYDLISLVVKILTDRPLFFLINSYTTGLSPASMGYMLMTLMPQASMGVLTTGELGLPVTESGLYLPAGASARWQRSDTFSGENK